MITSGFSLSKAKGQQSEAPRLPLTSLVDVMTILLVFLIQSFSADGNIITPSADVNLPVSTSKEQVVQLASIAVTDKAVLVDDSVVVDIKEVFQSDSMIISQLYSVLTSRKLSEKNGGQLMIQSDKETDFAVTKKIMYTCSKAGFTDYTFLVMKEE